MPSTPHRSALGVCALAAAALTGCGSASSPSPGGQGSGAQDGAVDSAGASPETLREQLLSGGNVVFIRHAEAGASETEGDPAACGGPQQSLDDLGREQVADIEAGMSALQPPVSEVITSEACRTLVTADAVLAGIADRPPTRQDDDVAEGDALRELLSTPVPDGGNLVVVGHSSPFEAATGLSSGARGTTVVLEQRDGQLVEIGRLTPAQWRSFAGSG